MTQKIDYATMSDQDAFYAYMDRRHSRTNKVSIAYDNPEWDNKMIEAIRLQMKN